VSFHHAGMIMNDVMIDGIYFGHVYISLSIWAVCLNLPVMLVYSSLTWFG
jgi:hypothetical protein